jgi:hypothetical protein
MIAIHELPTRGEELTLDALLHFYCVAHTKAVEGRSAVTIHRKAWAYCVAGGSEGHEWMAIQPISYADFRWCGPTFTAPDR